MTRIAIHGREVQEDVYHHIQELIGYLKTKDTELYLTEEFKYSKYKEIFEGIPVIDRVEKEKYDCFLSLGGDGTFLETITYVRDSEIPILGINTGRLGFLATISREDIHSALDQFFRSEYEYDIRTLLSLESEIDLFNGFNFALNEFAIIRKDTSSMINIECRINGQYLATYWADGLMVATPTGSTGYSLSCGGPIIMPQSGNFIITPVSPHNLNVRPLVLSDKNELSFKVESRSTNFLVSMDSRSVTINSHVELRVSKANFNIKLIKINGSSFIETLRNKLSWGLDRRN